MSAPIRRLGAVLEAIGSLLPDDILYRVGGPDAVARNDAAKRIVMEPQARTYEPGHGSPRALFTRVENVRMHIWGATIDDVEEIEELLINAIVQAVTWTVRPGGGQWRMKATADRGFLVVQEMGFLIPILRREVRAPLTEGPLTEVIATAPTFIAEPA